MKLDITKRIIAETSAGMVVYRKTGDTIEYLTIYRSNMNDYSLPKGHVDDGESLQETAKREVKEETGYEVNPVSYLGNTEYPSEEDGVIYIRRVYWFLGDGTDGKIVGDFDKNEVKEVKWVSFEVAVENLTYESDKNLIQLARSNNK